ncbi:MAG: hypothetical protein JXA30_20310 [Deltaproteobacteria bacterium]|nr:hypothetical protein [Deltaproteobacteria bacterium]
MTCPRDEKKAIARELLRPNQQKANVRYRPALLLFISVFFGVFPCSAQYTDEGDGAYGRLDDDTILSYGAAFGLAFDASQSYALDLRARYLDSAGFRLSPEIISDGDVAIAMAIDLRPFFLGRFLTGNYSGRSWVDLTIDSIGIEVGSLFGPLNEKAGVAFLAGTGFDMPLGADGSNGLWLRFAVNWIYAGKGDIISPDQKGSRAVVLAVLYYRSSVDLGIASWEPPRF